MTKKQTFGKLLSNVYIVYIPPIFVRKILWLALIRWSVFTRGFRQDQKYLPRLREAFKTSKIEERQNWDDENQHLLDTPRKFNIAPKKWWLEDYFPIGKVTFQGLC